MNHDMLAWYNVIFYIPLVVGLLMAIGMATGVAGLHHDVGVDGDGHADHGHAHDTDRHGLASLLGFGKVPVLLVVLTMLLTFGGIGVSLNLFLDEELKANLVPLISIAVAAICTIALTGTLSRVIARIMPTTETASTTKQDLIGVVGTLTLIPGASVGLAQITKNGDMFQIHVQVDGESLAKGASVLVTEYDPTSDVYRVCAYSDEITK